MEFLDLDNIEINTEVPTPPPIKDKYGYCCGYKMVVESESKLVCIECNRVAKNLGGYGNKPESQKAQYNSYGGVMPGSNILKTDDEKIQMISLEYKEKIESRGKLCELKVLRTASEMMFQFSRGNTKKSQNRKQLFGACLYYSSIRHGNLMMDSDITDLLGLNVKGISTGIGIITKYAVRHKIPFEFDPPIYRLAIKYYLKLLYIDNQCLNTKENRKFCRGLVEEMNKLGIGYDKGILVKCNSAVYYLMYYRGQNTKYKKKEFTSILGLPQHTYTPIFELLTLKECNMLLSEKYRINFD